MNASDGLGDCSHKIYLYSELRCIFVIVKLSLGTNMPLQTCTKLFLTKKKNMPNLCHQKGASMLRVRWSRPYCHVPLEIVDLFKPRTTSTSIEWSINCYRIDRNRFDLENTVWRNILCTTAPIFNFFWKHFWIHSSATETARIPFAYCHVTNRKFPPSISVNFYWFLQRTQFLRLPLCNVVQNVAEEDTRSGSSPFKLSCQWHLNF